MTDLIRSLRQYGHVEAADAIESLTRLNEELREALELMFATCTSTKPGVHDDCGTCIVTAPSMEALKKASAALNRHSSSVGGE